ncbi:MAG: histidine kinase [Hyphomicrobium sp.]
MSIQIKLNIAIGLLLLCAISATISAVMLDAAPRVKLESASTTRLAKAIVQSSLITLDEAADPRRTLERLVASLAGLRHVRVSLASHQTGKPIAEAPEGSIWSNPLAGGDAGPPVEPIHAIYRSQLVDVILIAPNLSDEMDEVWATALRIVEYGVLFSLALVPLTGYLINRSLHPVVDLARAMRVMEDGDYNVHVLETGPPEISGICSGLNRLASALRASRTENLALSARMVEIQDEERRDIARELHDELGPHLFAIRARASFLDRAFRNEAPDLIRASAETAEIASEIEALQQTNRRVLSRLSPAGLRELGLAGAVQGMAAQWRKERPEVELALNIASLPSLSETQRLTIYRICQEGLTNAYRHAVASRIELDIDKTINADRPGVRVALRDNGVGVPAEVAAGHGISGMRERVTALGGMFKVSRDPQGGTRLEAIVPATRAE